MNPEAYPTFTRMIREAYVKRGTKPGRGPAKNGCECALDALQGGTEDPNFFPVKWARKWGIKFAWVRGFVVAWDCGKLLPYSSKEDAAGFRVGSAVAKNIFKD